MTPFNPYNPLEVYYHVEKDFMAAEGYIKKVEAKLRSVAVRVIIMNSRNAQVPDAFVPYLALNYLDRYVSRNKLASTCLRDYMVLAAIACLILALKNTHPSFPLQRLFLGGTMFNDYDRISFDGTDVSNMEKKITKGLQEKMYSVTAVCFVNIIMNKLPLELREGLSLRLVNRIIFESYSYREFVPYRHSVLAASAILTACRFVFWAEFDKHTACKEILLTTPNFNDVDLEICSRRMTNICMMKNIFLENNEYETAETMTRLMLEEEEKSRIGEGGKEPESEGEWEVMTRRRPRKELIGEAPENEGEAENMTERRPGKEPMVEIPESEGEAENMTDTRSGKEPMEEVAETWQDLEMLKQLGFDFELNWSTDLIEEVVEDIEPPRREVVGIEGDAFRWLANMIADTSIFDKKNTPLASGSNQQSHPIPGSPCGSQSPPTSRHRNIWSRSRILSSGRYVFKTHILGSRRHRTTRPHRQVSESPHSPKHRTVSRFPCNLQSRFISGSPRRSRSPPVAESSSTSESSRLLRSSHIKSLRRRR